MSVQAHSFSTDIKFDNQTLHFAQGQVIPLSYMCSFIIICI